MLKLATLLSILLTAVGAKVAINPVTFNQCESTNISWSGGVSPFFVYVYPNWKDPVENALSYYARLGPLDNTSTTWLVTFYAGEELKVNVRVGDDVALAEDFTEVITVGPGVTNACVDPGMARFTDTSLMADGPTASGSSLSQPTSNTLSSTLRVTRTSNSNSSSTTTGLIRSTSTTSPNGAAGGCGFRVWWNVVFLSVASLCSIL